MGGPGKRAVKWLHVCVSVLVADRSEAVADLLACASSLLVTGQIPARCRSATSLGPVCDQDSVMKFGFYVLLHPVFIRCLTGEERGATASPLALQCRYPHTEWTRAGPDLV